jgi:hypothetical protein
LAVLARARIALNETSFAQLIDAPAPRAKLGITYPSEGALSVVARSSGASNG